MKKRIFRDKRTGRLLTFIHLRGRKYTENNFQLLFKVYLYASTIIFYSCEHCVFHTIHLTYGDPLSHEKLRYTHWLITSI